jgi:hypothetical protein
MSLYAVAAALFIGSTLSLSLCPSLSLTISLSLSHTLSHSLSHSLCLSLSLPISVFLFFFHSDSELVQTPSFHFPIERLSSYTVKRNCETFRLLELVFIDERILKKLRSKSFFSTQLLSERCLLRS